MLDLTQYQVHLAQDPAEVRQAQRLRYRVFVTEMGGTGVQVDHDAALETDRFDSFCDHLILRDVSRAPDDQVVGAYRLMSRVQAKAAGGFSSAAEYDLSPLLGGGRRVLELGRSCVHPDYRRGPALLMLWQALAAHVAKTKTEILFGVASFPGAQTAALAGPLSLLHHDYLAGPELRPTAIGDAAYPMDILPPDAVDRKAVMVALPPLIKAYLRIGGRVGSGAFIDHAFNTVDICMVVDMATVPAKERAFYSGTNS